MDNSCAVTHQMKEFGEKTNEVRRIDDDEGESGIVTLVVVGLCEEGGLRFRMYLYVYSKYLTDG